MAEGGIRRTSEERMEEVGAMKGMIYQHIKTYEMGLSAWSARDRYEVGTSRSRVFSPRRGGRGLKGSCVFCPSVGLQDWLS
jgi:hypothetical protein